MGGESNQSNDWDKIGIWVFLFVVCNLLLSLIAMTIYYPMLTLGVMVGLIIGRMVWLG